MNHPFVEFLIDRGVMATETPRSLADRRRRVREPLGMVAVGHGLLQIHEIDVILDRQRECRSRFGDIAVELGILTRGQVDTLLKIQEFRMSAGIAEALALAGVVSQEDAVIQLGGFLVRDREVEAMISEM